MKYYVENGTGIYLLGQDDAVTPPANSTEVSHAPNNAKDIWDFGTSAYIPYTGPNPELFKTLIWISATIPAAAKAELWKYYPLVDTYVWASLPTLQAAWATLKSVYVASWLPAEISAEVEGYAVTSNMPLVP